MIVHVFVARGAARLGDADLVAGDAARLTAAGDVAVTATEDNEIIVWATDASVDR